MYGQEVEKNSRRMEVRVQNSTKVCARESSSVPAAGSQAVAALAPGSGQSLVESGTGESGSSPMGREVSVRVWKQILQILSPLPSKVTEYSKMRRERDREIRDASLFLREAFPDMRESLLCPGCKEKFPNTQNLYRHLSGVRCKLQVVQQWAADLAACVGGVEKTVRIGEVRDQVHAGDRSPVPAALAPSSGQSLVRAHVRSPDSSPEPAALSPSYGSEFPEEFSRRREQEAGDELPAHQVKNKL